MRIKSICFLLFLLLGAFLSNAKAQSGYGYSYIEYDEPSQTVYAESGTILDYGFAYYYDPGIQGSLYKEGILVAQSERVIAEGYSGVVVWTEAAAEAGKNYTLHADHYVGAYWYYNTSGGPMFIDHYGLNNFLGTYSPPYSFGQGPTGYYSYRIYKVATTQVSIQVPKPPPSISIDATGAVPGANLLSALRGSNLFGNNQSVQVSGNGVTITIRPTVPNEIEVLEINIEVAEDAEIGEHNVTLTVDGQTSNTVTFRVGDRSPVISNITPPEGNEGDQVPVTITGTGFGLNPLVQIDGFGVNPTITSATSTEIRGIFTIADSTYAGNRNVNIFSRGISGNGFILTPGSSNTSNSVGFEVAAPTVTIDPITFVEKNGIKAFNVKVENALAGNRTRFVLRKTSGTGSATFADGSTEIIITGNTPTPIQLQIKGITESSQIDNFIIEPKLNNNNEPIPDKSKRFTVVTISSLIFEKINSDLDNNGQPSPIVSQRIFPDKDDPNNTTTDKTVVNVKATVAPAMSKVNVYFANFDLDDPSSDAPPLDPMGIKGNDNNGTVPTGVGTATTSKGLLSTTTRGCTASDGIANCMTGSDGTVKVQFKVTMQPGDNFGVSANLDPTYRNGIKVNDSAGTKLVDAANKNIPISGEANTDNVPAIRTKMLTVWRRLNIEIDSMGNATGNKVTGTLNENRKVGAGTKTLTINVPPTLEPNRFENGRMVINGVSYPVVATTSTQNANTEDTVTIQVASAFSIRTTTQFTLYDDDDMDDEDVGNLNGDEGDDVPEPNTDLLQPNDTACNVDGNGKITNLCNVFLPAYVRPADNFLSGSQNSIQFDSNLTYPEISTLYTQNFGNIGNEANPDFWTVYLFGAYQLGFPTDNSPEDWDADPGLNAATRQGNSFAFGTVDALNGIGATIFTELNRPREYENINVFNSIINPSITSWQNRPVGAKYTTAHELGHLFYGEHNMSQNVPDSGLMAEPALRSRGDFSETTINRIRGGLFTDYQGTSRRITHP